MRSLTFHEKMLFHFEPSEVTFERIFGFSCTSAFSEQCCCFLKTVFLGKGDLCDLLDSPSMELACRWPPAGQDFEKRHLFVSMMMISVSFWTPQVWDSGASGFRQVRILKIDFPFLILMISASFSNPAVWASGASGLRRVRIFKKMTSRCLV